MTLNVTAITADRIYQSSDYRLSRDGQPIGDTTMKLVQLQYPSFDGFISYTGLATVSTRGATDTAFRIMEWLEGSQDLNFHEVVERVRSEGTAYLARVEREFGRRERLTFIAAAFVRNRPVVAAISNFQRIDVRPFKGETSSALVTSWASIRSTKKPVVVFTGSPSAVSIMSQRRFVDLLREHGGDSARVRNGIAELNRLAAVAAGPEGPISESCTVISVDSSGRGSQDFGRSGAVENHYVVNGRRMDLSSLLESMGIAGSSVVVGSAFARSGPQTSSIFACERVVTNEYGATYEIVEIESGGFESQVYGVHEDNSVIGSTVEVPGGSGEYWVWEEENGRRPLGYSAVNPYAVVGHDGEVALFSDQAGHRTPVYIRDSGVVALEVPDGMGEAEFASMAKGGLICGQISINQDNTDPNRFRPALWDAAGHIYILDNLLGGLNGRAVHASPDGLALVWVRRGAWERMAVTWDYKGGAVRLIGENIIPLHITGEGYVFGIGQKELDQFPLYSSNMRTWHQIGSNLGFAPSVASDRLLVAGRVKIDGNYAPFCTSIDGPPVFLPRYEHHNHFVRGMNDSGVMVGSCSTDEDAHSLLWRPK